MIKKYFFYILCFFFFGPVFGQIYDFKSINQEDGLPSSTINAIFQDSRDYLWFGTEGGGLVKYDGISYEVFNKNTGLNGEYITDIVEDDNNNIVVATRYSGIYVYDGSQFVKSFNERNKLLSSNKIFKLLKTAAGVAAISDAEVVIISPQYTVAKIFKSENQYGQVNALLAIKQNEYLIATDNGLFTITKSGINPFYAKEISGKTTACSDQSNRIFIGTNQAKLFVFEDNKLSNPEIIKNKNGSLFSIKTVFVAKSGNVWMGSYEQNGICLKVNQYISFFDKSNGFNGQDVQVFFQDKIKNLYIGTHKDGLYKTSAQQFINFSNVQYLNSPSINAIAKNQNKLYISIFKRGVFEFNSWSNGSNNFVKNHQIEDSYASIVNNKNQIIFGTATGLSIITGSSINNVNLSNYLAKEKLDITCIIQDAQNRYFITTHGQGIIVLDQNFKFLTRIVKTNPKGLSNYVSAIVAISGSKWYVGTSNGLFLLEEKDKRFYLSKSLINESISIATKDVFGNFWFSVERCLYVIRQDNTIICYNEKNGLKSTLISTLIAGKDGFIYLGTNLGLAKIQVNKKAQIVNIQNYNSKNGFYGRETNLRAQFRDERGNVFFGTNTGLYQCLAQYKTDKNVQPKLQIAGIGLFNEVTNWNTLEQKKGKWENLPEENYEFKSGENQLTFRYLTINNKYTESAIYSYILEGVEKSNWSAPTMQREVTFSNLSYGNYTFKVKIIDNLGNTISNEASYSFSIEKPFYFKWWFVLIFLCLLYAFVVFVLNKTTNYNKDFIKNYSESKTTAEEYKLYLLFLGISLPVIEAFSNLAGMEDKNTLQGNIITSILFLSFYFLSKRYAILDKYISLYFSSIFVLYVIATILRLVKYPDRIASSLEFIMIFFIAYSILKSIKLYWIFVWSTFGMLIILYLNGFISKTLLVTLIIFCFLTAILNYVRHISNLNSKDKFLFADNIVNKGTSLILGVNLNGEVVYSSDTITAILGYKQEEVKGLNYWILTGDSEFTTLNYHISDSLYVRKLRCKDGSFKYIQWKDYKYSNDLYVGVGQDISEQVDAQNQYRNLIETATDIIYEIDNKGNFTYINHFTEEISGFAIQDVINKNFIDFIRDDYKEYVAEYYKNISSKKINIPVIEFPIISKNKGDIWLSQKVAVKKGDDNKIIGFSAIARDITQIKKLETEKKVRQEKIEAYTTTINKLVTIRYTESDSIEKIIQHILKETSINSKISRVSYWEYEEDKIVCLSMYNKNTGRFDSDDVCLKSERPIYFKSIENNKFIIASDVNKSKEFKEFAKEYFPENNIKSVLDVSVFLSGQISGILSFEAVNEIVNWDPEDINFARSISDIISISIEAQKRKESEQRFRLLANNIPGTVYLSEFDEKWTKIYLNDEIEKLTGYKKDLFLNKKLYLIDLVHEDDREAVLNEARIAISQQKPFHLTYRLKRKSGECIWIEEFGDTVLKDGKIDYVEGILIDITQRKEIDSQIKAREYAEAANKAKSDFLANMSHEIRTPLNAIIGFSNLLNETALEANQLEYSTTVNQSAHILLEIVNDILDFSKIESGKLELENKLTNLQELINQVIHIIQFDSEKKNISLNLIMDEEVPKYVEFDGLRIKQILLNLLSNAVKFTKKGKVELQVELAHKNETHVKLRFLVIDSGIGIKVDNYKKIFEPFSQEDSSTTRKYGGTGLGLAISNNILSLMNSKLELKSDLKRGSTFYFDLELPYFASDDVNEAKLLLDYRDIDVEYDDLSEDVKSITLTEVIKVLVVEDNKINMLLTKTLLKKFLTNAVIIEAENGQVGIDKFVEMQPDIILLDVQMPVLNGYEAAAEIRKLDVKIPIIALTAGTVKGEKDKCIEVGMNDYISKPIIKEDFENMLVKWLQ